MARRSTWSLSVALAAGALLACKASVTVPSGTAGGPGGDGAGGGGVGSGGDGGSGSPVAPLGESYYWLQNTSLKVQPTTAPAALGGGIALEGARGGVESYQVVIRPPGAALTVSDATPSDLRDGAGDVLPAANVSLFVERFIDFTGITTMGGNAPAPASSPSHDGRVPDALVPFHDPYTGAALGVPFDVAADTNQPLWVDVRIPIGQPAGTYTGSIAFSAAGQTLRIPLSVKVWDITLPDLRSVPGWFRLDYNKMAYYHPGDCFSHSCTDADRQVIKRYQELMHDHRLGPGQPFLSTPGGCDVPSFTAFDPALAPYMDGSAWSDGAPSPIFSAPFGPGSVYSRPQSCGHDAVVLIAKAWAEHLKQKGWFDRTFVYSLDEPTISDLPTIAQHASWMMEADPDWKSRIFVTTTANDQSAPILDPVIGIYVQCLKCFDAWKQGSTAYGRADWAARLQSGMRLWFYESNAQGPPYPTFATNTLDAAEPRLMMWGSWYEGATGFLYWSVNAWDPTDPWGPTTGFGKTGDGVLLYPGQHSGTRAPSGSPAGIDVAGPIPTIRLKMVRSGLQDWALFVLADRTGRRSAAMNAVATVYGQMGGCTWQGCLPPVNGKWFWKTDYELMAAARRAVAEALLAH